MNQCKLFDNIIIHKACFTRRLFAVIMISMKDSVTRALSQYAAHAAVRFHMPGHKGRGVGRLPFDSALPYDVTELEYTDNLYTPSPNGIFRDEINFLKSLYGTAATLLTAGGATSAVFAALAACARRAPGLPVLCDRKAHLSVIHALALLGLEPIWLDAGTVSRENVGALSKKFENIKFSAVFATSPDYYGQARDIPALAELAKTLGAPLIVDNSHGSHLFFYDGGRLHPLRQGANLVIDSIHKTLPALTGAALLHAANGFSEDELRSALRLAVSTSPSYLISSSACACLHEMAERGEEAHAKLFERVARVRDELSALGYTLEPAYDPFRLCISDKNAKNLYEFFADRGIVCEFYDGRTVVLLTSVRNTKEDFECFLSAARQFVPTPPPPKKPFIFCLPKHAIPLRDAVMRRSEIVPISCALGRVAAEPAAPYPPGIPLIVPGEIFDDSTIGALSGYGIDFVAVTAEAPRLT